MPDGPATDTIRSLDSILNILSKGWIGTIVGLAGIVLAVVFYLRASRKPRLAFQNNHVTLVGGGGAGFPDEVEIRFGGTVVPSVTTSTLVIWNCGDRTISGEDVVTSDPLRVEVSDGGKILKHRVHKQTRSVNGWNVDQPSPNRLDLSFDYLDPSDGICLEITHSQPGSELRLAGTIKGIPAGLRRTLGRRPPLSVIAFSAAVTCFLIVSFTFSLISGRERMVNLLFLVCVGIPLTFFVWNFFVGRFPRSLEPRADGNMG